jgi:hypothetical protein
MSSAARPRHRVASSPRLTFAVVLALVCAAVATSGRAQENFRVTFAREQPASGPNIISGTVYNDARLDAHDVYVTAQALNGAGKVVASGIAYVAGSIPAGRSATFTAKVPAMPGVERFRVTVTSARMGYGAQSP